MVYTLRWSTVKNIQFVIRDSNGCIDKNECHTFEEHNIFFQSTSYRNLNGLISSPIF